MKRARPLALVAVIGAIVGVGVISFLLGGRNAAASLSVRQVTPDQLAVAMKTDQFYADYRQATLLVRGSVAAVSQGAHGAVLEFRSNGAFKTLCQSDQNVSAIHEGDTLTAVTEGADAVRQPSAVMLSKCVLLAS